MATTNIYVLASNQQHGPYGPDNLKSYLQNGQIAPTLLCRFDGCVGWVPIFCLPEIQSDPELAPLLRGATSGDLGIELAIVEKTLKGIGELIDRLARSTSTENAELQKMIQRRTQILWRQLFTFKGQFPEAAEAKIIEASYHRILALTKFNAHGFLRRQAHDATNVVWQVFTGLLANRQERAGALEALGLLDKAIAIFDNPDDRLTKATIYNLLGQRADALRELTHLFVTWPAAENLEDYIDARQLRDEIETT